MTFASPGFSYGALALRLALASIGLTYGLSLAGCGSPGADASAEQGDEGGSGDDDDGTREPTIKPRDAGTPGKSAADAAEAGKPSAPRDDRGSRDDAGSSAPLIDAGDALGEVVGSVDWDAIFSADGGLFTPAPPPGPASPDNPKECPETAPENPVGSCIGVPVYATCNYGSYSCLCDWIHWLCI